MPDLSHYVYGGLSAITAEAITFPIDTAKTRLQLQGQDTEQRFAKLRYRGMGHCITKVVREEGAAALYRGLSSALVRQAVYGTLKFGLYYSAKEALPPPSTKRIGCALNLGCAVWAGCVSSAIATPTDVIKVRMQSNTTQGVERGLLHVGRDIITREGVRGLWRGVFPTAQRAALVAGVQLPVYDFVKAEILGSSASNDFLHGSDVLIHSVASMIAGFSAAMASNPCDVIRTRMMAQRKYLRVAVSELPDSAVLYRSAGHCALHTVRTEGPSALYKGFVPSFARMGPWNVIFFVVYEKFKSK